MIPKLVLFGGLLASGVQTTKEKAYMIVEKKSTLGNDESVLKEYTQEYTVGLVLILQ